MPDSDTEMRIVRSILDAINTGKFPLLANYQREFGELHERLLSGDYRGELWEFLLAQPTVAAEGMKVTVRKSLEFIESEVRRYAEIKASRPLTEGEKRFGKEILMPLLESVSELMNGMNPGATD